MNTAKKTRVFAYKTWLAGIGVVDTGREKAANKFDQLFVEGSALVNDLLEKGEAVESQLQAKLEARKMLKEKISALKSKLGFGNQNRDRQIDLLSQRVDNLVEVVAKLAQQKMTEKKPSASASKKTQAKAVANETAANETATKASTKSAAKVSTTKAAAKPAAKTSATKAVAKPTAVKKASNKPKADNKN